MPSFENEWVEVEVRHPNNWKKQFDEKTNPIPKFLWGTLEDKCQDDQQPAREWRIPMYKQVHLEIDVGNKSDRIEWGHCKYHSFYRPDRAFELVVQWVAASGTIVADLVSCKFIIRNHFKNFNFLFIYRYRVGQEKLKHAGFK